MIPITRAKENQDLEQTLVAGWGVPVGVLQERAALGIAMAIHRRGFQTEQRQVAILAGPGNNGADALAAGRILADWGCHVEALTVGDPSEEGERQAQWLQLRGVKVRPLDTSRNLLPGTLLVDGLFGSGLNRAPEGIWANAINWANTQHVWRVAVDLPSGIETDTGIPLVQAIQAHLTVACGTLKLGALCDPALAHVGELIQVDIGFPQLLTEPLAGHVNVPVRTPPISLAAHKGDRGTLVVLGGSSTMSGAPGLVASAAARRGCGLILAAVPAAIRDVVAAGLQEAVVVPLADDPEEAWEGLEPLLARSQAVVAGPGMVGYPAGAALIQRLWLGELPLLLDAGALQPWDDEPVWPRRVGPTVLTPHPGEMGRLLGITAAEVQRDRLGACLTLARQTGAVVVLKGARTIIGEPDGHYWIDVSGGPELATAGSGDVLAGMIGVLLAQGSSAVMAARTGVALHGRAGKRAVQGRSAILASDLLQYVAQVQELPDLAAHRDLPDTPLLDVQAYGATAFQNDPRDSSIGAPWLCGMRRT